MIRFNLFIAFILVASFFSCDTSQKKKEEPLIVQEREVIEELKPEINFYFYEQQASYPDAIVEMYTPLGNQVFRPGKIPFEFNIKNFLQDSGVSGFQLKMILNGGDPMSYSTPIFQQELKEGTYRAVAYLVDSEGLALKEFGNYVDRDFRVGDTRPFPYQAEPYLALNRPYNNQTYSESEEVLIDFLVLGGEMELDQLKINIELNDLQYEIAEVTPIKIAHLPKGEYQLTLSLFKRNGKELDGPFSSVKRNIRVI
jgi:hypothetical protein